MQFAKWVFRLAGIYGIVTVAPLYLAEGAIARATVPISHPEYFYGFVGLCVVWQIMFLLISRDPSRWRPAMPVALLEKLSFSLPVFALYAAGRVDSSVTTLLPNIFSTPGNMVTSCGDKGDGLSIIGRSYRCAQMSLSPRLFIRTALPLVTTK